MAFLLSKSLDDITFSDIESLISLGDEEGPQLEFKEALPARDGGVDPWQNGARKVSDYARDALAKEIVAFANAYGGLIVVGIAETNDSPRRADKIGSLVRSCTQLAENLEKAISARIDPPVPFLEVRGVARPDDHGAGFLLLRVGPSDQSPHGFGSPPATYVRRRDKSEPMTMRDIQAAFWEARTKRERLEETRDRFRADLRAHVEQKMAGRLFDLYSNKFADKATPHLAFRCSAIPVVSLGLGGLATRLLQRPMGRPSLIRSSDALIAIPAQIFGSEQFAFQWQPMAHGARAADKNCSVWKILDNGALNVVGLATNTMGSDRHSYYPGWFIPVVVQIVAMQAKLRYEAGRPDVPFILDCEFVHDGKAHANLEGMHHYGRIADIDSNVTIGPFEIGSTSDITSVVKAIEREIWYGMGVPGIVQAPIDIEQTIAQYVSN